VRVTPSADARRALVFTALAFLWSIGLLVAALVAPVYGSATLVDENGHGVLIVVAIPAVISLVVWLALWRKCLRGSRISGLVAWTGIVLLSLFCLLAMLSIGIFVAPVALLLACAASLTPSGSPAPNSFA
jgi:hypothetical protein